MESNFSKGYNSRKEAGIPKVRDIFQDTENRVLTKDALEIKYEVTQTLKFCLSSNEEDCKCPDHR